MEKVAFVMMLDHSASIKEDLALVKIDARAFIRCTLPGDQFAINMFSDEVQWLWPTGADPKILTVSDSRDETQKADVAIKTISAKNMTELGNAIKKAQAMLEQATVDKKVLVLLSDGENTQGPKPEETYNGKYPVHVAAIGYWAALKYFEPLKEKNPDCRVHWKPQASDMMKMFNEIRGDSTGLGLLVNDPAEYVGADFHMVALDVSEDSELLQFEVTWSDARCHYVDGTPKDLGMNVFLVDPQGERCPEKPTITADGYCIVERRNVTAGKWHALVQYDIPDHEKISGVIACFIDSPKLSLQVDVPSIHTKGEPLVVKTSVWDGDRKVENVLVKMRITRPSALTESVLLRSGMLQHADDAAGVDKQERPTDLLGAELKRSLHTSVRLLSGASHKGEIVECINETEYPGPYNIEWEVSGINPSTGKGFSFVKTTTVLVGD